MPLFKGKREPTFDQTSNVAGPAPGESTYPCKVCGRKFVKSTLSKHEPACKKLAKMNRKVFDSGKQRAGDGSDVTYQGIKQVKKELEQNKGTFPRPKTHWKQRHEEFVGNVRAAREVDYALKTGTPLPPPPKSSVPSDYVKCDYCGRNFNQQAAERHIPNCKEQNNRLNPNKAVRPTTKFQAPKPPTTTTSQRRSAPSPSRQGGNRPSPSRQNGRPSPSRGPQGSRPSPSRGSGGNGSGIPQPVRRSNSANSRPPPTAKSLNRKGSNPGKPATSRGRSPAGRGPPTRDPRKR